MQFTSESVETLVEQFTKLPTIGRKTARRLVSFVLKMPRNEVVEMADALVAVKDRVKKCQICSNVTDDRICSICLSPKRDHGIVCVVEEANDLMALERTHEYRGVYHVLGGVISPLDGIGPDDLAIRPLIARITPAVNGNQNEENHSGLAMDEQVPVREVILAMNPNVEGDTTAYYLTQLLNHFDVRISRIARGLPIGGDLEFADEATLSRALEARVDV